MSLTSIYKHSGWVVFCGPSFLGSTFNCYFYLLLFLGQNASVGLNADNYFDPVYICYIIDVGMNVIHFISFIFPCYCIDKF